MSETQDSAARVSRANRGYRTPAEQSDFLQAEQITSITYNANGDIETMTKSKEIPGQGTVTKTYTFAYSGTDLTSVSIAIT